MPLEILIRRVFKYRFGIKKIFLSSTFQLNLNFHSFLSLNFNYYLKIIKILLLFKNIIDQVGVDNLNLNKDLRFTLYYNFLNINHNCRCLLSLDLGENTVYNEANTFVYSASSVFEGLNWLERENWDLLGIFFFNHPDLRRILTDYGFEGFPLRKDFPLTGFFELRYDEEQKSILYEDVELSQEFRFFDFESPWKS